MSWGCGHEGSVHTHPFIWQVRREIIRAIGEQWVMVDMVPSMLRRELIALIEVMIEVSGEMIEVDMFVREQVRRLAKSAHVYRSGVGVRVSSMRTRSAAEISDASEGMRLAALDIISRHGPIAMGDIVEHVWDEHPYAVSNYQRYGRRDIESRSDVAWVLSHEINRAARERGQVRYDRDFNGWMQIRGSDNAGNCTIEDYRDSERMAGEIADWARERSRFGSPAVGGDTVLPVSRREYGAFGRSDAIEGQSRDTDVSDDGFAAPEINGANRSGRALHRGSAEGSISVPFFYA